MGSSNTAIDKVPAGLREVTVFKAGYVPVSLDVEIPVNMVAVTQKIVLERGEGPTPPTTPPTTIPTTAQTTAPTTSPTTPGPFPPIPTTGGLFVYTVPFGSSVFLDEVYLGISPSLFTSIPPGTYEVVLELPGYAEVEREVTIFPGDISTVSAMMVPDIDALLAALS
jgi:PEGA domain